MLNVKKLQAIRDKILGVTADPRTYGDLNSVVYLQQILDAVQGVTSTPSRVRGNLNEKIYLQKILNAKRGVADGRFGSLPNSIYLQQIINAYNGVTDKQFGSLSDNFYLNAWTAVATPAISIPWYLSGGVAAANCKLAYKAIGAASLAASYVNLANPGTNDLTTSAAPTFAAATGWKGDGATKFLETGYTPPVTQNISFLIRYTSAGTNEITFGLYGGGNNQIFAFPQLLGTKVEYQNGKALDVAPGLTSGVLGIAGLTAYRNGIAEPGNIAVGIPTSYAGLTINILRRFRAGGASDSYFSGYVQAFAFYDAVLTPAQMLAVSTAMANLT